MLSISAVWYIVIKIQRHVMMNKTMLYPQCIIYGFKKYINYVPYNSDPTRILHTGIHIWQQAFSYVLRVCLEARNSCLNQLT